MKDTITIKFQDDTTKKYEAGTTYFRIGKDYQKKHNIKIIGAKVDNQIVSLDAKAKDGDVIEFFDATDINGYKMNQSGLKFVLEVALKETFGNDYEVVFDHSISRGLHMTIVCDKPFDKDDTARLKLAMQRLVDANERIFELNVAKKEAMLYYAKTNHPEKASNVHNITSEIVPVYRLKKYVNYFYTAMPYSTGMLNQFDLVSLGDKKVVLLFPSKSTKDEIPSYVHYQTVIDNFKQAKDWAKAMGVPYLSDINQLISKGKIEELIRAAEINYDNDIHDIVEEILARNVKYVMLAGPSSSGKTTSTKKLALALKARGFEPLVLSVDNYFKDRDESPKDKDGNYDFECLEALDLNLLNKHLKKLLNHEEVDIPEFNFTLGEKEYRNKPIKLSDKGIILMEGLHCINDAMTSEIDPKLKYKIYLSPFIPLNLDKHTYVSTIDLRLLRRMVRDNRTRNSDVSKTIGYWQTVRKGEEKHIFPFIDGADKILNTSLIYEIGVMKVFAEPLLYSVPITSPYYEEARRLISFLKGFFPIPSDYVSKDSILREFIGGSSFE